MITTNNIIAMIMIIAYVAVRIYESFSLSSINEIDVDHNYQKYLKAMKRHRRIVGTMYVILLIGAIVWLIFVLCGG
ncbi:MAG: hypothetical protein NC489_08880 [Ruminococcus flavefaciens]|nr:hypothetical protein [Ruminococcus flavefaciens]